MTAENDEFLRFEIEIESIEESSMKNGENAFIIYLRVYNKTPKSKKINLSKATYVTKNGEQIEQDVWLSGYIVGEDNLKPNSFKKAGLIFYKSKLKTISEDDIIYISTKLPDEGKELTLCFQKNNDSWILIDKENNDTDIKLTPKQLQKILSKRIERFEPFEERLGVSIQNLSLKIEDSYIWCTIYLELHALNGITINESLEIESILYDKEGSIIDKKSFKIFSDDFFGFKLVEIQFTGDYRADQISKIRIYPQK